MEINIIVIVDKEHAQQIIAGLKKLQDPKITKSLHDTLGSLVESMSPTVEVRKAKRRK